MSQKTTTIVDDISPDGMPLKISAAPVKAQQEPPVQRQPQVDTTADQSEDAEEKSNIDFNQFLEVTGKPKVEEPKPEEKKVETTPPEDKVVEPKDEPVKEPVVDTKQPVQTTPIKTGERDFTGIDEKDVPLFKKMGNEAFNSLKPIYLEQKKLKVDLEAKNREYHELADKHKRLVEQGPQIPESYYEHSESYLLDPGFRQAIQAQNISQQILAHWQKQYEDVAAGAKDFDYLEFNPQTGQLQVTRKIEANRATEGKLISYITHAQHQANLTAAEVQALARTHQEKHATNAKGITDMRSAYFSGLYKTPEDKAIYEPMVKQTIESFPAAFRQSPIAHLAAESLVMNRVLAELLKKAADEKQATKTNTNGVQRQPSAAEIAGNSRVSDSNGKDEDVSIDAFNRVKEGY